MEKNNPLTIQDALVIQPPAGSFYLQVSKKSIDALISYEITSEGFYNKRLTNPVWPGGVSGITIGIGYDLGCTKADTIKKDWGNYLASQDLNRLLNVAELSSDAAARKLGSVKSIVIPLQAAKKVFYQVILPRFAKLTRNTYPGTENLFADAQGALISLVYNRGCSLGNTDGRKEMRAIKPLVAAKDYKGIAGQFVSMKRLWDPKKMPGLISRRDTEASMILQAGREYSAEEIIRV